MSTKIKSTKTSVEVGVENWSQTRLFVQQTLYYTVFHNSNWFHIFITFREKVSVFK